MLCMGLVLTISVLEGFIFNSYSLLFNVFVHLIAVLKHLVSFLQQAFDVESNSSPFSVTVQIELVNDNSPRLLLDSPLTDYATIFNEGQSYLGGPVPVRLSGEMSILDDDTGDNYVDEAIVEIYGSK